MWDAMCLVSSALLVRQDEPWHQAGSFSMQCLSILMGPLTAGALHGIYVEVYPLWGKEKNHEC